MGAVCVLAQAAARFRGSDGGPVYVETDFARFIVEPWNAASALLFVAIAAWWALRLRGCLRRHTLLAVCLPILLVGGIGGTVYHAFRASPAWLVMDWLPIVILCFTVAVYLWQRLLRRWCWVLLIVPLVFAGLRVSFAFIPVRAAINLSYGAMAAFVLVPALLVLRKAAFRHAGWVAAAAPAGTQPRRGASKSAVG
jgi:hemolysin III